MSAGGSDIAKTATEAGGFLKNYCEPRPHGFEVGDFSYEKGSILKGQEGKQKEYKSLVDCDLSALSWKIMDKFRIFACACLNAAVPGTIYFGVADNKKKKYEHGEILGLPLENIKDNIMDAFQRVLDDHIESDEGKLKRGGDQNCFTIYFVPVKIQGMRSELYVVEIEVVRDWDYCKDNVYYFREWTEKSMQGGGKDNKSKKALSDFYKMKQDQWDDVHIRTNNASSCVKPRKVNEHVRKPLKVKYDRREQLVQPGASGIEQHNSGTPHSSKRTVSEAFERSLASEGSSARHAGKNVKRRKVEATGVDWHANDDSSFTSDRSKCSVTTENEPSCYDKTVSEAFESNLSSEECSIPAMDQKAPTAISKDSDHASVQSGSSSANNSEQSVGNNGCTLLHTAVQSEDVETILAILCCGFDIDSRNIYGRTPLMIAAESGRLDTFNLLLERGADPFLKDNYGWTLLHRIPQGGNDEIIEKLLSLGLDIDSRDSDGSTPLMVAAENGRLNAFNLLLERGADSTLKENYGWTVLHRAAQGGNDEIIEKLLSLGLDIDSRNSDGATPLIIAASYGRLNAFNLLLERGADATEKGNKGCTMLHWAARGGNDEIIEKLLSLGLDINSREISGETPLMVAAYYGQAEAVKYLLSKGAR